MIETSNGVSTSAGTAPELTEKTIEKMLPFVRPNTVFSAPVVSGPYTVITASAVLGGGGMGFGSGTAPAPKAKAAEPTSNHETVGSGAGGGGAFYARPVAAIVIGPDGVKVQPITDATRIAIAVISAWAAVALMAMRIARAKRRRKLHRRT